MKSIPLSIFCWLSLIGVAQNWNDSLIPYQSFLDTNKLWIEEHHYDDINNPQNDFNEIQVITLEKFNDSVFNVNREIILRKEWINTAPFEVINYTIEPKELIGQLYEDTAERVVYQYPSGEILYDFSIRNDSIYLWNDYSEYYFPIDSLITNEFIDGSEYQTYFSSENGLNICNWPEYVDISFEEFVFFNSRMGGTRTLLEPFGTGNLSTTWNHNYCNLCYFENEVLLNNNGVDCELYKQHYETGILSVDNKDKAETFCIYPNPTSSTLNFSGEIKFQSYKIVDMQGKIFDSGQISNDNLDVSNLKQGLYYLIIGTENGLVSKKFTKI